MEGRFILLPIKTEKYGFFIEFTENLWYNELNIYYSI